MILPRIVVPRCVLLATQLVTSQLVATQPMLWLSAATLVPATAEPGVACFPRGPALHRMRCPNDSLGTGMLVRAIARLKGSTVTLSTTIVT